MPDKPAFRGKVLVVEDEAYVRESLAKLLRARGFDVVLADGLEAALARLGRISMDLVLTDLKMPGGGGLEVVKRVRESSPGGWSAGFETDPLRPFLAGLPDGAVEMLDSRQASASVSPIVPHSGSENTAVGTFL